jgi:hypothetical protein
MIDLMMIVPGVVPTPDPNPLPAPYWVFKLLLLVTFFLHILAMNFMLGGTAVALMARLGKKKEQGSRIFFDVAKKLPSLMAATITLGIAPLLFVQVIYGQYFYTSSIVMAWPWILVILFLIFAYYGFYFVANRGETKPKWSGQVLLFSLTLVLIIGFIYTNNVTLSQAPASWMQKYFASTSGWSLNLGEPTLIPRYLHFMTAAVAVGGLLLVMIAWSKWKEDVEYARALFQFGGKAFMYANMAQFAVGLWFLMALPREMRMLFMGDNPMATMLMGFGVVGGLAMIFLMSDALRRESIRMAAWGVSALTALVILSMIVMRDILRDAYLGAYFHPQEFAVKTQWSPMLLFLGLFVAGVALWVVMMMRYGFFKKSKSAE